MTTVVCLTLAFGRTQSVNQSHRTVHQQGPDIAWEFMSGSRVCAIIENTYSHSQSMCRGCVGMAADERALINVRERNVVLTFDTWGGANW